MEARFTIYGESCFLSKTVKPLLHVIAEYSLSLGRHVCASQFTYDAGAALKDVPEIELGNSAAQAYGFAPGEEQIAEVVSGACSAVLKQALAHGKGSIRNMNTRVHDIVDRSKSPRAAICLHHGEVLGMSIPIA